MSRAWARGSTRSWRKIRAAVLRSNAYENGGRCQLAIPGVCTGTAQTVHHTRARTETGDDRRHLQAACDACNLRVTDPTATPTHTAVVQWIREHGATTRAVRAHFPHLDPGHISVILSRAIKRGELERIGRGVYRAGPTGLPDNAAPQPKRVSRW